MDISFYKNKKVFITGHTGFKGTWMCKVLIDAGAEVTGYALEAPTTPSLFEITEMNKRMNSIRGDVRNLSAMMAAMEKSQAEIVIHMAAQPLVRESYQSPVYTYETNVMGTVNVLECVRNVPSVRSFLNVTTDKVYRNREWEWGYRENEELNGYDPYSNSKSCSELVTESYKVSFFGNKHVAISTARAGNVIGGGDFAADRLIPDCVRAAIEGQDIIVRNPISVRPFQHVLEPVMAYLMIAAKQYEKPDVAGCYNIGPEEQDCLTAGELTATFCDQWKKQTGNKLKWVNKSDGGPHEANYLKLDCSKVKKTFGWKPVWNVKKAVEKAVEWTVCYQNNEDAEECMRRQIQEYLGNFQ